MTKPYLEHLEIRNLGCLKHVELELTPFHALIGPNDTGKTTALVALQILSTIAFTHPHKDTPTQNRVFDLVRSYLASSQDRERLFINGSDAEVIFEVRLERNHYSITKSESIRLRNINSGKMIIEGSLLGTGIGEHILQSSSMDTYPKSNFMRFLRLVQPFRYVRLDPDTLRISSTLIPSGQGIDFNSKEARLAGILDRIMSDDIDSFIAMRSEVKRLFPSVDKVRLQSTSSQTKEVSVELKDGTVVPAALMSEGLLYYLGFKALQYLEPVPLILVEEPENGLHPARIKEVMRILRELSKTSQVILATHSPLVINEMKPEEVTVLTRDTDKGTIARPIKEAFNFEERNEVYALGELWLSHADGETERALFEDPGED